MKLYGVGIMDCTKGEKTTKCYQTWKSLLGRCLKQDYKICDEWLTYSSFGSWYENNCYEIEDTIIELNTSCCEGYIGPGSAIYLPKELSNHLNDRGPNAGIYYDKRGSKYVARLNIKGKTKYLGGFDTELEARNIYKEAKKNYIEKLIRDLKGIIPDYVFEILQK